MRRLLTAAALAVVVVVPGASATEAAPLRVVSLYRPVFSPNGNGINDTITLRTNAAPGTLLGLRVYVWGGRLSGWKRIRTGMSSTSPGRAGSSASSSASRS